VDASEESEAPLNYKILFAVLFVVGTPLSIAIRMFWIPHLLGAAGVGFTLAYGVVLALMWSGAAPRERKAPKPAVVTSDAWIFLQMIHTTARLAIVNTGDAPLRIPGLADGVAAGLTVEVLQGDRSVQTISMAPRSPSPAPVFEIPPTRYDYVSATFNPWRSPSARTVELDFSALRELAPGQYDLRIRWNLAPFAGAGLWSPPEPLVLGMVPFTARR
jgi:hypothetical protein